MAGNLRKLGKLDERKRMQEGEAVTTLERGSLLIRQRKGTASLKRETKTHDLDT
jgi:hypothetical protein